MMKNGLHQKVIRKAERPTGLTLAELSPNSKEIAQRLIQQGALIAIGGNRYKLSEATR